MKKKFITTFLVIAIMFGGLTTTVQAALTPDQVNSIIGLLQSFGADQTTINNVRVSLTGGTPAHVPPVKNFGPPFCYKWNNDLTVGSHDNDVYALDEALYREGIAGSTNLDEIYQFRTYLDYELGGYGPRTVSAVKKLQAKYGIRQTGYVGPLTRAQLNKLYQCKVQPSLTILSPNGGEKFFIGQSYEVKWKATVPPELADSRVKIGLVKYPIATSNREIGIAGYLSISDGKYIWNVDKVIGGASDISPGEYIMQISIDPKCSEYQTGFHCFFSLSDRGDAAFTITQ